MDNVHAEIFVRLYTINKILPLNSILLTHNIENLTTEFTPLTHRMHLFIIENYTIVIYSTHSLFGFHNKDTA